jgi:hypothetical protein
MGQKRSLPYCLRTYLLTQITFLCVNLSLSLFPSSNLAKNKLMTQVITPDVLPNKLPANLQFWIRPMLIISVVLHGLVLATPMKEEKKAVEPAKKEPEKVKITQLPTKSSTPAPKIAPVTPPKASSVVVPPKPAPVVPPKPAAIPPIVAQPKPPQPVIPPPIPPQVIPRPQPIPSPSPVAAQPIPSPSPVAAQPIPSPSPVAAQPSPSPVAAQPSPPPPPPSTQDPFADFPVYPNAVAGSLGLAPGEADKAARNTTTDLATVVAYYDKELASKKFESKPTTAESTLKVFQVSKGGVSQYLHLIGKDASTVIVLAPQPLDLKSLADVAVEPPEAREFQSVLGQLLNVDVLPAIGLGDLQDAGPFQTAEVKSILGEVKDVTPQALGISLESGLRSAQFEVSPLNPNFGGGILYQVKKSSFIGYLTLVPTRTAGRTGVITLKKSPN